MINLVWLVPLFPLIGVFINGFWGRKLPRSVIGGLASAMVGLSFIVAVLIFFDLLRQIQADHHHFYHEVHLFTWISAGAFEANIAFLVDPLSTLMMLVVTGVGFLIHVYSIGYMDDEPSLARYFTYLNLFTFAMLLLVLGNNFLLMFVGWEGVGLCSYLLIGFWFEKQSASDAGKKAFIVNRIGDFAFILGVMLTFSTFVNLGDFEGNALNFYDLFQYVIEHPTAIPTWTFSLICLLLFLGATGKSAQIPLYVWLPDAMEGPTPVSALIHAATMVTAGIYMVARCHVFFLNAPDVLAVVAVIGVVTAIFSATIALVQTDIKKVLAYSTVSQLGYMFLGCGVGAFTAGIFHVMTHAFFKALLFMGAGSVIHALHHEQDIRNMGGLKDYMPKTRWTFLIATIAIAGIPPLSGFFSKDEILWYAFSSEFGHWGLWLIGAIAAFMTSFYMFRLYFLTFHGECRVDHHTKAHLHESPSVMTVPLIILAFLAAVGGFVGIPHVFHVPNLLHDFLHPVFAEGTERFMHESHGAASTEFLLMAISVLIALAGLFLAWNFYLKNPKWKEKYESALDGLYTVAYRTLWNKYYVDELYDLVVVKPVRWTSERVLWKFGDGVVIEGIVNGVAKVTVFTGQMFRLAQTGYIQNYAVSIVIGLIIVFSYFMLK
ncbi:MAG: NADH-quinone oxidoreductase subunit L [Gemmatimonadetes bacterium]|nr:MAG: NADH-quinone oxidoreductase subunit L [Gemmatimonadota bacterium]